MGRLLSGIATSLLFSVFEAWMVSEHHKRGFSGLYIAVALLCLYVHVCACLQVRTCVSECLRAHTRTRAGGTTVAVDVGVDGW